MVDLPAYRIVLSVGRFVDHVAVVISTIEIGVLAFDMACFGPDALGFSVG